MGSKSRIARHIVPIIHQKIDECGADTYIEPFVGGANVIDSIKCEHKVGYDINRPLISLLTHAVAGGELPYITRDQYEAIRDHPEVYEPWEVGNAGFLASYNGKYFGGYAGIVQTKIGTTRDYVDEARRNLLKQVDALQDVDFACMDYRNLGFRNCVIYCDPPYASTTGYQEHFDSDEFWDIMREWSKTNTVLISEQAAPNDFKCIWECEVTRTQDNASRAKVTEKLFVYDGVK